MGKQTLPLRYWTPSEDAELAELAPRLTGNELAARLQRTPSAIRTRASGLGIRLDSDFKHFGRERGGTRPASVRPTVRDLAWAAGFMEGEGCFRRQSRCTRLSAKQIGTREPLERLVAMFGGVIHSVSNEHNRRRGGKARDGWEWTACGARARGVAMTLFPLLSRRRQDQVRRALA